MTESNHVAYESELKMARLLVSPSYKQTSRYYLYGGLLEYIHGKTVEEMVEDSRDEDDEIKVVIPV